MTNHARPRTPCRAPSITHSNDGRRRESLRELARKLGEPNEVGAVSVAIITTRAAREIDDLLPLERSRVRRATQQHPEPGDGAGESHRLGGASAPCRHWMRHEPAPLPVR